ncbi:hypothetical protein BpHYR1_001800, partial [Brachionus plicatilis]
MENDPKTVSNESVLMNSDDDTLVDAENVVVLKQTTTIIMNLLRKLLGVKYLSKGCRASLYLQSTEGSSGHCFVSIDDHSNHPEQEREKIEDSFPNQVFRVFLTTKKLIQFALETNYILSDATYKITYGRYPALTGGTTDKAKKFHPFGLALCATENNQDFAFFFRSVELAAFNVYGVKICTTILVADNADAITKGFQNVFRLEKRTGTFSTFNQIIRKKWKSKNSNEINDFVGYFMKQWGNNNNGWYEGYY